MTLVKLNDADIDLSRKGIWKSYIVQLIITVITFTVLAFIIVSTQTIGGGNGATMGFLAWLGFYATNAICSLLWEKKSLKLILIQSIVTLLNLVIGGAIIGAWR
jgi:hypothetical protein